jgi:hypothetical protein
MSALGGSGRAAPKEVPGRPDDVRSRGEDRKWSADGQNDANDPNLTSAELSIRRQTLHGELLKPLESCFRAA